MGIQHAPAVGGNELGKQDLVEAGENDELGARPADRVERARLTLGAPRALVAIGQTDLQARGFRPADGRGARAIAADEHDAGRKTRLCRGVDECLEVGPAAGGEDGDLLWKMTRCSVRGMTRPTSSAPTQ